MFGLVASMFNKYHLSLTTTYPRKSDENIARIELIKIIAIVKITSIVLVVQVALVAKVLQ